MITEKEFNLEKENLERTNLWLTENINSMEEKCSGIERKMAALKKETKFKYNSELESLQNIFYIQNKTLNNYMDIKDQPYFARLDFKERLRNFETFYIGKIGLSDEEWGDEIVVDWRAPIADLYYSGTKGEAYYESPIGIVKGELLLKRKFIIRSSELKDAFDEGIDSIILKSGENNDNALVDEFLIKNLEENTSSKLKDVVSTIQKEQNSIIRAEMNKPLVIQGYF